MKIIIPHSVMVGTAVAVAVLTLKIAPAEAVLLPMLVCKALAGSVLV